MRARDVHVPALRLHPLPRSRQARPGGSGFASSSEVEESEPRPERAPMSAKLRIVGDGTPAGTQVYAGDQRLRGVQRVEWTQTFHGGSRAVIHVIGAELDGATEFVDACIERPEDDEGMRTEPEHPPIWLGVFIGLFFGLIVAMVMGLAFGAGLYS